MTRHEYEQRKQRLDEQLRAGIELLEAAHRAQVRALDLVWMLQAEEGGGGLALEVPVVAPPPGGPPAPAAPRRRSPGEMVDDLNQAFWRLPETFTRRDVCAVLGYEPDRGALYRILQDLVKDGFAAVQSLGEGKRATVYRKIERAPSAPEE
jgi:hypothetical protein